MNLFTYVKNQLSILAVVSEYAHLKKAGIYWKGQCPFHSERTASFTVSPHKEIFYCFGCQAGGDVITFITKVERCTPLEAAQHLIDRYQISVPESLLQERAPSSEKNRYYDICELVAQWCHEQLRTSESVVSYIQARGITQQYRDLYRIGYFPGGPAAIKRLLADMAKHKILADDLLDVHIISRGKNTLFSPFEERIMFPIADHLGRVCGFGGRVFKVGDTRPKYYNSHENSFFTKGHLLFGLHNAKKAIQDVQKVILVEGYTDCIAVAQHGFPYVVATLGTACTQDHLKLLGRYTQQLYIMYDGDQAGIQAILRIAEMCWQVNLDLYVIPLPAGDDPASFVSKGGSVATLIAKAQDIFAFFIQNIGTDFSRKSLAEKVGATKKILDIIARIEDTLKQSFLLQQASDTLCLPLEMLQKEMAKAYAGQGAASAIAKESHRASEPAQDREEPHGQVEKKIFYGIMNNIDLLTPENGELLVSCLAHPISDILEILRQEKIRASTLTFNEFFQILDERYQHYVSKVLLEHQGDILSDEFERLLAHIQKKHWKVVVNDIKIKLERAKRQGNEDEVARLVQDFITLQKKVLEKIS